MLDKTKNYNIDVSALSTVERTALQEQLFLLGYAWYEGGQKVTDLDSDTLFLDKDMDITCGNKYDFNRFQYPILTVADIMPQSEPTISLRDLFAGDVFGHLVKLSVNQEVDDYTPEEVARDAYRYADAMLKERNK